MTGPAKSIKLHCIQPFRIADGGWIPARLDMRCSGSVTRFAARAVLRRLDCVIGGEAQLSGRVTAETASNGSSRGQSGVRQVQGVLVPRRGAECFQRGVETKAAFDVPILVRAAHIGNRFLSRSKCPFPAGGHIGRRQGSRVRRTRLFLVFRWVALPADSAAYVLRRYAIDTQRDQPETSAPLKDAFRSDSGTEAHSDPHCRDTFLITVVRCRSNVAGPKAEASMHCCLRIVAYNPRLLKTALRN